MLLFVLIIVVRLLDVLEVIFEILDYQDTFYVNMLSKDFFLVL